MYCANVLLRAEHSSNRAWMYLDRPLVLTGALAVSARRSLSRIASSAVLFDVVSSALLPRLFADLSTIPPCGAYIHSENARERTSDLHYRDPVSPDRARAGMRIAIVGAASRGWSRHTCFTANTRSCL